MNPNLIAILAVLIFLFVIYRLTRHELPHSRLVLFVGPQGVETDMFTIKPGQTKTLTAAFTDDAGNNDPLGTVPVATDPNNVLSLTALGTPTINDKSFSWSVSCPDSVVAGTALELDVHAEGDPTAGVDPLDGKITGVVIAPEDTHVTLSVE